MALVPTLVALTVGIGLGLRWGGDISNITSWRPPLWEALASGLVITLVVQVMGLGGGIASLMAIIGTGALFAFTVVNIRTGGMILITAGLGLNLLVTILNWGMPVNGSALVSAGLVDRAHLDDISLSGGRAVAEGPLLGFLGGVIPLPWGQVISVGDLLVLVGLTLVTASVMRGVVVGGGYRRPARGGGHGYSDTLSVLGKGPAPRRGPGLHPSRLAARGDRRAPTRRTAGRRTQRPTRAPGTTGSSSRGRPPR